MRVHGFSTIVGQEDKHRVVILSRMLQMRDEATEVEVHRFGHAGIDLHPPRLIAPVVRRQVIPVFRRSHRDHVSRFRNETQCDSTLAPGLPQGRPASVIDTTVVVTEGARRLHGNVDRLEPNIGKKGLAVGTSGTDV